MIPRFIQPSSQLQSFPLSIIIEQKLIQFERTSVPFKRRYAFVLFIQCYHLQTFLIEEPNTFSLCVTQLKYLTIAVKSQAV